MCPPRPFSCAYKSFPIWKAWSRQHPKPWESGFKAFRKVTIRTHVQMSRFSAECLFHHPMIPRVLEEHDTVCILNAIFFSLTSITFLCLGLWLAPAYKIYHSRNLVKLLPAGTIAGIENELGINTTPPPRKPVLQL